MRITFRPNLFGRSFGRKLGVLYDDYVKDVFVSACAINKREDDIVLHTQEGHRFDLLKLGCLLGLADGGSELKRVARV
jgi:hypothetical protein